MELVVLSVIPPGYGRNCRNLSHILSISSDWLSIEIFKNVVVFCLLPSWETMAALMWCHYLEVRPINSCAGLPNVDVIGIVLQCSRPCLKHVLDWSAFFTILFMVWICLSINPHILVKVRMFLHAGIAMIVKILLKFGLQNVDHYHWPLSLEFHT